MPETLTLLHANNKGTDQTAHQHSLISILIIHYLESATCHVIYQIKYGIV